LRSKTVLWQTAKARTKDRKQKAKTMKTLKTLAGLAAGVATCALLCQPAAAGNTVLDSGSAILPSANTAGVAITVNYEVDSAGTAPDGSAIPAHDYLYTYIVHNANGVVGGENLLDFLSVSFMATSLGSIVNPGNTTHLDASSAQWFFGALAVYANSPTLWFESIYPPTPSNADASDLVPPSPFASGGQVDVPNVPPTPPLPDGGMTLSLLGFALMGVEGLRRKLAK
jgi:hypothetical protein